jgi:hypothetical protein
MKTSLSIPDDTNTEVVTVPTVTSTVPTVTSEEMDRLIHEAPYQQHHFGKVWQPFDPSSFSELVGNIRRRGLDQKILLYNGMVLEGWHRYLACLHTGVQAEFAELDGTDLEAAERVHASGVRRQSTAEQRYASFLLLCEACPAFKEKFEELKTQGKEQKQAGTPLSTGGQRVDVVRDRPTHRSGSGRCAARSS